MILKSRTWRAKLHGPCHAISTEIGEENAGAGVEIKGPWADVERQEVISIMEMSALRKMISRSCGKKQWECGTVMRHGAPSGAR